jgi:DNA-binding transcriptional ArsR family regulator
VPSPDTDAVPESAAPESARELDRVIHERTRLAIVGALAAVPSATFKDLKSTLGLTDGNLSVHTRKLEEAGYIDCHKSFDGRTPRTEFVLTEAGRRALNDYVRHMESLIQTMRHATSSAAGATSAHPERGSRSRKPRHDPDR